MNGRMNENCPNMILFPEFVTIIDIGSIAATFLGLIDKLLNWSRWIHLLWPQKGVTWGNRLSIERPGWGKRPRAAPGDIWVMKRDALKGAIWKSGPWPPGLMAALFWL